MRMRICDCACAASGARNRCVTSRALTSLLAYCKLVTEALRVCVTWRRVRIAVGERTHAHVRVRRTTWRPAQHGRARSVATPRGEIANQQWRLTVTFRVCGCAIFAIVFFLYWHFYVSEALIVSYNDGKECI